MVDARVHQEAAVTQDCTFEYDNGNRCGMAVDHGPFSDTYQKYQNKGWRGTLFVRENTKAEDLPYGYTGLKFADVWPTPSDLHSWSHKKNTNIVLRMPRNVIGIDADQYEKHGIPKRGIDNLRALEESLGKLPSSYRSTRRGADNPSGIRFYRVPVDVPGWPGKVCDDVETIHHGHRFAVVGPSQVPDDDTGELLVYQWFTPQGYPMPGPPSVDDLPLLPRAWVEFLQKEHNANGGVITSREDFPDHVDIPDEVDHSAPWYMKAMARPGAFGRGNDNLASVVGGIVRLAMKAGEPFAVAQALALNYERASDAPQDDSVVVSMVERFWAQDTARKREAELPEVNPEPDGGSGSEPTRLKMNKDGFWLVSDEYTAETGYIGVVDDRFVTTQARYVEQKKGEDVQKVKEITEIPLSNFHLEPTRVFKGQGDTSRAWMVKVIRDDGELIAEKKLTNEDVVTPLFFKKWITASGVNLYPKNRCYNNFLSDENLIPYFGSFELPELEEINTVGWHPTYGCYVMPEGVLFPGVPELKPHTDVIPADKPSQNSGMSYGTEVGIPEALKLARDNFRAHDPIFMSLLYSMITAIALRGQYQEGDLFPGLNLEGFAESGKSTVTKRAFQLIGVSKIGRWTKAAMVSVYNSAVNGAVIVDDAEIKPEIQEVLRNAITGSGDNKMNAIDGSVMGGGAYRAATVIASEGMTHKWNSQKANRDRFITFTTPKPTVEQDEHYEQVVRPQWNRFGKDYTKIAGAIVAALSAKAHLMRPVDGVSRQEQGRNTLRNAARVAAEVFGIPELPEMLERAFEAQKDYGRASTVLLEVIPTVFRDRGMPTRPGLDGLIMPVWLHDDGHLRVNTAKLADAWRALGVRSNRDEQLTDASAIEKELKQIEAVRESRATNVKLEIDGNTLKTTARYWVVPQEYTDMALTIARGDSD